MRALGIDYGRHRIGIALADPTLLLASPFSVIENKGSKTIDEIADIIKANEVGVAVVGLALHMDGTDSEISRESRAFAAELEKRNITVEFTDERFTTKIAQNAMREQFGNRRGNAKTRQKFVANSVDKISASVILQSYLDKRRMQPK
jgi:putative Holliday junction resolvase